MLDWWIKCLYCFLKPRCTLPNFYSIIKNRTLDLEIEYVLTKAVADVRGAPPLPTDQNFLNFMQFFGEFGISVC